MQERGLWWESRSFSKCWREEEWKTGKHILKNALHKISLNFRPRVTDSNTGSKARPAVQNIIRKIKYWSCLVSNRETKMQKKEIKWRGSILYITKISLYLQCDAENQILSKMQVRLFVNLTQFRVRGTRPLLDWIRPETPFFYSRHVCYPIVRVCRPWTNHATSLQATLTFWPPKECAAHGEITLSLSACRG